MTGVQHKVVGVGFGIAGAYIATAGNHDPYGVLIAATSIVGCMLPDIDHDKTKIGRKRKVLTSMTTAMANVVVFGGIILGLAAAFLVVKGFADFGLSPGVLLGVSAALCVVAILKKIIGNSKTFKWATKHRGLMHTLVVPAIMFFALKVSDFPLYHYGILGLLVGYLSHLFADMLTVEGCPILFPLTKRNIRFPTKFKTKSEVCTTAAYAVAILSVAFAFVYVHVLK